MSRKKATATGSFSVDSVQFTNRAVPTSVRYSPYREIANKLMEKGTDCCVEKLPDKNAALRVTGYMRIAGLSTRIAEVEGSGWCVWNKGKKKK